MKKLTLLDSWLRKDWLWLVITVMMATYWGAWHLSSSRYTPEQQCNVNLELIALACDDYTADHDSRVPSSLNDLYPQYLHALPTCGTSTTSYYLLTVNGIMSVKCLYHYTSTNTGVYGVDTFSRQHNIHSVEPCLNGDSCVVAKRKRSINRFYTRPSGGAIIPPPTRRGSTHGQPSGSERSQDCRLATTHRRSQQERAEPAEVL